MKCGGACLEVCETISRGMWEFVAGTMKENDPEKNKKKIKIKNY